MASTSSSTWRALENFQLAMATYRAACTRWPEAAITLRQGAKVIEGQSASAYGVMSLPIFKCATALLRFWRRRDSYDVVADGVFVGRIFLSQTALKHRPWM
jgi:hypothetical protein